jgi:hypothetical protein
MNDNENTLDTAQPHELNASGWWIGIEAEIAGDSDKVNDMTTPTDDSHWMPHIDN